MAKQMVFETDARAKIKEGVEKLARAVTSTLGPRGRNAILDKGWGAPTITKDGVTVAEEIQLQDPYEHMGAQLVKEVASKTSDVAGDGTTTATALTAAIFGQGLKAITAGAAPALVNRALKDGTQAVIEALDKAAKKVSSSAEIRQVATISANNDAAIGKLIGEAMDKVGKDGVITVEDGKTLATEVTVVEGMQFDRGFLSPHFVTNPATMVAEFENPLILVHEAKISSVNKLLPLLEAVKNAKKSLIVIAEDIESEALATLVVNKLRGIVRCAAVKAPGYGDRRKAMLEDISILTGAKAIMSDLGLELDRVALRDLGTAKKVIIDNDKTTIIRGAGAQTAIKARVEQIREQIADTTSDYDREKLQERMAKLTEGIATIMVGGATDTEVKERKALIEDALHATRAAVEGGVLPGGGVALLRARAVLEDLKKKQQKLGEDYAMGLEILHEALARPLMLIAENAGHDGGVVAHKVLRDKKATFGFDALKGEYCDMLAAGIIDPAKVTKAALQNATSVASLLLTTDALIANKPEKKKPGGHGHDHGMDGMDDMDGMGGMGGMGGF